MTIRNNQAKDFIETIIGVNLLEEAIGWIGANMNPEDVFSENDLRQWAEESGFVEK